MKLKNLLFALALLLCQTIPAEQPLSTVTKNAVFSLESPTQTISPGSELQVVLSFHIDPGWHLYWKNTGGIGHAPTFDWQLPDGVRVKNILWPSPKRFEQSGTTFFGYDNNPQWLITLWFSKDLPEGVYPVTLSLFWISCNHACVPETQQLTTSFEVKLQAAKAPSPKGLHEVKEQLPIPVTNCSALVDNTFLSIRFTPPSPIDETITQALIFPEEENIVPVEAKVCFEGHQNEIDVTVPLATGAKEELLSTHYYNGIIQLVVDYPSKKVYSYSIHAPVSQATMPLEPHREQLWKCPDSEKSFTADQETSSIWIILTLAFVGGLLLNLTPCVLPVIGMKILHLISYRNSSNKSAFVHGLTYTLGVLTTFWILAATLYSIQYAGQTIGWGFQLQEPRFVIILIVLLFCFSLNLFGLFEFGTSLATWSASIESTIKTQEPRLFSAFASGALATLIATPCTGPFLGSVLGFAASIHPLEGLLIFTFIGLGIASPFLILTAFPRLIQFLPKPGVWMLRLKQLFAFFILGTILWLLFVLQAQVPTLSPLLLATGFVIIAFALWMYGSLGNPTKALFIRLPARIASLLILATGALITYSTVDSRLLPLIHKTMEPTDEIAWKPFSEKALEDELAEGHVVFVAFSAKWCLTCQTNDVVFLFPKVRKLFHQKHIVALEADWTTGDSEITHMLHSLGRNGVPVYAIFKKGQSPVLLPEILSQTTLIEALSNLEPTSPTPI